MTKNTLTMTVGGVNYTDWTALRLERGIDRMATDFEIGVTERAIGQIPWSLMPFAPVTIALNGQLALTGYIDSYTPSGSGTSHAVKIAGRSKTEDLIDCSADIQGGQFSGYTLDQIARSIATPYGISVIVQTDMGDPFDNVQTYRHETNFAFLERLCRLRGVLACDDPTGNLVLTTAGATSAAGALREFENIERYSATLSGAKRFSHYAVIGQRHVDDDWDGPSATEIEGDAEDSGVPRYRPHVVSGETALDQNTATLRAQWQSRYNAARGIEASITVSGWTQPNGQLWAVNQIAPVHAPSLLKLDRDLLIVRVNYSLDDSGGALTTLTVGPEEGWAPDPGQVKRRKVKGTSDYWSDLS